MLNANFQGLLSTLQPFSHLLTQLPLIIVLPCETYSQVSPGKLYLSSFKAEYIEISRLENSRLEQTPPYQGTHLYTWVKRSKRGTNFWAGFEPRTPGSRVFPLDYRPHVSYFCCSALDKLLGQLGIYPTWLSSIVYLQKQLRIFIFFYATFSFSVITPFLIA